MCKIYNIISLYCRLVLLVFAALMSSGCIRAGKSDVYRIGSTESLALILYASWEQGSFLPHQVVAGGRDGMVEFGTFGQTLDMKREFDEPLISIVMYVDADAAESAKNKLMKIATNKRLTINNVVRNGRFVIINYSPRGENSERIMKIYLDVFTKLQAEPDGDLSTPRRGVIYGRCATGYSYIGWNVISWVKIVER